jgi:hypothetical protein
MLVFDRLPNRGRRRPQRRRRIKNSFFGDLGQEAITSVAFRGQIRVLDQAGNPIPDATAEIGRTITKPINVPGRPDLFRREAVWEPLGPRAQANEQGIITLTSTKPVDLIIIRNTLRAKLDAPGFTSLTVQPILDRLVTIKMRKPRPGLEAFVEGEFVGAGDFFFAKNKAEVGERFWVINRAQLESQQLELLAIKGPQDTFLFPTPKSTWPAIMELPKEVVREVAVSVNGLLKSPAWVAEAPNFTTLTHDGQEFQLQVNIPPKLRSSLFPTSATNRLFPIPTGFLLEPEKLEKYKNLSESDLKKIFTWASQVEVGINKAQALAEAQAQLGLNEQDLEVLLKTLKNVGLMVARPAEALAKFLEVLRAPNEEELQDLAILKKFLTPNPRFATAAAFARSEFGIYYGDFEIQQPPPDGAGFPPQIKFPGRPAFFGMGSIKTTPWGIARSWIQNAFTFEQQVREYPWPTFGLPQLRGSLIGSYARIFYMGQATRKAIQEFVKSGGPYSPEDVKTFITASTIQFPEVLENTETATLRISVALEESAERRAKRKKRGQLIFSVALAVVSLGVGSVVAGALAVVVSGLQTLDSVKKAKAAASMAELAAQMEVTDQAFADEIMRVADLLNAEAARKAAEQAAEEGGLVLDTGPDIPLFVWIGGAVLLAGVPLLIHLLTKKK